MSSLTRAVEYQDQQINQKEGRVLQQLLLLPLLLPTCSESTSLCSETTGKGFVLPVLACVGVSVKSLSQAGQEVTM